MILCHKWAKIITKKHSEMIFIICTILFAFVMHPTMSVPVVDIFCYNGEPMSLFRLLYLSNVVDLFVIIEANMTHSGKQKPYYLIDQIDNELIPLKKTGKLLIHKINFPSHVSTPWEREKYQRIRGVHYALKRMDGTPFLAIIGDPDEIPRKELIRNVSFSYTEYEIGSRLKMKLFYYSFRWVLSEYWASAFIMNDIGLRNSLPILKNVRFEQTEIVANTIYDAGWHCSYFMNITDIIRKMQSFAHTEYSGDEYTSRKRVEKCISEGMDIYNRSNIIINPYDGSDGYPFCDACKLLPYYHTLHIPST